MEPINIPLPPEFTEEQLNGCGNDKHSYMLFEWYKYVARLANYFSCISLNQSTVKTVDETHYSVLIGLLNRCSRLIFSNVTLSRDGLFGETTSIIDRCIFESAVKLSWLCSNPTEDNFNRFIAEGLKTEIEFKKRIENNIKDRGGEVVSVERSMLQSIENYFKKSGLTEDYIAKSKKLPNLAEMIDQLGRGKLLYTVGQKIGSHHIHGTWVSLWLHYLDEIDGVVIPRDHNCSTHVNQYVFIPLVVLEALKKYLEFLILDQDFCMHLVGVVDAVSEEIKAIFYDLSDSGGELFC